MNALINVCPYTQCHLSNAYNENADATDLKECSSTIWLPPERAMTTPSYRNELHNETIIYDGR